MPPAPDSHSRLATYPFTSGATAYVRELDIPLPDLLLRYAYDRARSRGMRRVIQAIEGRIERDYEIGTDLELLSYPIARMIVSCVGDDYLIRRYALAEAKAVYESLKAEPLDFLLVMGEEFGMRIESSDQGLSIHFADYVRYAHRMRDPGWKLVNRRLSRGVVRISEREFRRLLQEAIGDRIRGGLPLNLPPDIDVCDALSAHIESVREALGARKTEFELTGAADPDAFPPCIAHAIAMLQEGVNLPHSARFAATSFLLNIGMDADEIVRMFSGSPDFDESRTGYQVKHITGREYTAPGCDTMKTYGNCIGADSLCARVSHPLNYYRIRKRGMGGGGSTGSEKRS